MPRQCILTAAERSALLAFPTEKSELIRLYTFRGASSTRAKIYCRVLYAMLTRQLVTD